ncbi:ABC-type branched-subunit amino acid transport system ATPase component [Bradyrhizobium sp. AZCC 2262]
MSLSVRGVARTQVLLVEQLWEMVLAAADRVYPGEGNGAG